MRKHKRAEEELAVSLIPSNQQMLEASHDIWRSMHLSTLGRAASETSLEKVMKHSKALDMCLAHHIPMRESKRRQIHKCVQSHFKLRPCGGQQCNMATLKDTSC